MRDNNSFHVLAKITFLGGMTDVPTQKHLFIHTSDEGRAVTLAKLALNKFKIENPDTEIQFTVKKAEEVPLLASTSPQEEIYSI